jgi:hypothetical protein
MLTELKAQANGADGAPMTHDDYRAKTAPSDPGEFGFNTQMRMAVQHYGHSFRTDGEGTDAQDEEIKKREKAAKLTKEADQLQRDANAKFNNAKNSRRVARMDMARAYYRAKQHYGADNNAFGEWWQGFEPSLTNQCKFDKNDRAALAYFGELLDGEHAAFVEEKLRDGRDSIRELRRLDVQPEIERREVEKTKQAEEAKEVVTGTAPVKTPPAGDTPSAGVVAETTNGTPEPAQDPINGGNESNRSTRLEEDTIRQTQQPSKFEKMGSFSIDNIPNMTGKEIVEAYILFKTNIANADKLGLLAALVSYGIPADKTVADWGAPDNSGFNAIREKLGI